LFAGEAQYVPVATGPALKDYFLEKRLFWRKKLKKKLFLAENFEDEELVLIRPCLDNWSQCFFLFLFAVYCLNLESSNSADPPAPLPLKMLDPGPPFFTEEPKSQLVEGSIAVRLNCRAEGNPTPSISWLKDGSPLKYALSKKRNDFNLAPVCVID